jgi:thiosulfate/3-mercaptopyruvate sulfurtransferase
LLTVQPFGPIVDVEWLEAHLGEPGIVVVDCRYTLTDPQAGERGWLEGHIPGAAFLRVSGDLAGELRDGGKDGGRAPLPAAPDFEASARRAGIGKGSSVVAYDEGGEGGSTRLWWLLRHFGHDRVSVLDGGLRGWREEGGPLEAGTVELPAPGAFTARPREGDAADSDALGGSLLLDARARERYRGEVEPIDPVAGHIPGAANLPFAELAPGGRFLAPEELRARFEAAGAAPGRELVAYCGSGVTACVLLLAAELAGLEGARLYPGSWSEWSGRGLPVERH